MAITSVQLKRARLCVLWLALSVALFNLFTVNLPLWETNKVTDMEGNHNDIFIDKPLNSRRQQSYKSFIDKSSKSLTQDCWLNISGSRIQTPINNCGDDTNVTTSEQLLHDKVKGTSSSSSSSSNDNDIGTVNKLAVFYNVYVPPDQGSESVNHALHIVKEQLGQIASISESGQVKYNITVYIVGIGKPIDSLVVDDELCPTRPGMRCVMLKHYAVGYEDHTLDELSKYCRSNANNNDGQVIYIHNKGSYHPSSTSAKFLGQDSWRRMGTAAAASNMCLNATNSKHSSCDVCGLLFSPLPGLLFPGNFWTASCKYVSKLIPPKAYSEMKSQLGYELRRLELDKKLVGKSWELLAPVQYGTDRYAAEHWIGSHPSIRPCDVSSRTANLTYWMQDNLNNDEKKEEEEFVLAAAPRQSVLLGDWIWKGNNFVNKVLKKKDLRYRDIYFLRGLIFLWLSLYNELPSPDSWIWTWFPDGEIWKEAAFRNNKSSSNYTTILQNFEESVKSD